MRHTLPILILVLAPLSAVSAQEIPSDDSRNIPAGNITDTTAFLQNRLPPPSAGTDNYVPSCLLDNEEIARRFSFATPAYTPAIASWNSGALWAAAGASAFPGMAAVESGVIGISQQFGNVSINAYGGAAKYGYFRGLSTQWNFGGSLQWQFAPRLGLTLFGSYATGAYAPGMAPGIAEILSVPSFGGYVSWDVTERFGVDVGVSANRISLRQWEARPIVAPYIRMGAAKVSVDLGGILYELFRLHGNYESRNPTIAPPLPILPRVPRN